ncbi:MAG: MFS transporter [Candidatus Neomarinimicrobiota bacterium]|nr:MAG: MFS transporter [Candidatus Neomarinimicrobiota bacterium]
MANTEKHSSSYQVSSYRWVVLVLFMLVGLMTQIIWITFAPITTEAATQYGVSTNAIIMLAMVFMIAYIPVNFSACWCIDKYGLKWGTGIGVILTGLFGLLRAFSPNYTLILICQTGCAIGQPFVLNSFTKLATNWFPEKEKTLATGLGTMSVLLGAIVGMVVTPFLFDTYNIHTALLIYGIVSLIFMALYVIFVKDKPAEAPNAYWLKSKTLMVEGLKDIFKNRDFIFLFILLFFGIGAFNAISSEIDLVFDTTRVIDIPPSLEVQASGIIGGLLVFGGILGAVILSALSDKYHKRRIFLNIAVGSGVPLTLLLAYLPYFIPLCIISFLYGFLLVSALPIGLTYAAEITYPVPEATSNGVLMLVGQIGGIRIQYGSDRCPFRYRYYLELVYARY